MQLLWLALFSLTPAKGFTPQSSRAATAPSARSTRRDAWYNPFSWGGGKDELPTWVKPEYKPVEDGFKGITPAAKAMPDPYVAVVPSQDLTGVTADLTRCCATLSAQIYVVETADDFQLSVGDFKCDILLYDDHGDLKATNPPFAVAITGDTMIAGWRGSSTLMDWISDAAFAPVHSMSWYDSAESLRTHEGFTALVESDLTRHGKAMVDAIEKQGLKRVIFTGHSLAGGTAQVANYIASGRARAGLGPWGRCGKTEFRTVAFAGPMVTLDASDADVATKDFVADVESRSCNIVFGQDVVPRLPGYLDYFDAVIENVIPTLDDMVKSRIPVPGWLVEMVGLEDKLETAYEGGKNSTAVEALTTVMAMQRHYTKIIYYSDAKSPPKALGDEGMGAPANPDLYSDYHYVPTTDPATVLYDAHLFFPQALAYNVEEAPV